MGQYNFCVYRQPEEQCRCYIVDESEMASDSQNSTVLWPIQGKVIEFFCDTEFLQDSSIKMQHAKVKYVYLNKFMMTTCVMGLISVAMKM